MITLTMLLISLTLVLSLTIGSAIAADNSMVLYFNFDEGSGTVVKDQSNYGNDGEAVNADWVTGKNGNGISIKGENSYVIVPDSPSLDITDAITLAAWIKYPPNDNWECVINKWAWNFSGWSLQTMNANNSHTSMWINGFKAELTGPTTIKDDTWHFLASTYDGTLDGMKLYMDGKLDAQGGDPDKTGYSGKLDTNDYHVGLGVQGGWVTTNGAEGGADWSVGVLDEVMIFNRALNLTEIQGLMAGGVTAISPKGNITTTWGSLKK